MPTTRGRLKKKFEVEQSVAAAAAMKKEEEDGYDESEDDTDEDDDDDQTKKQIFMLDGKQYDNYQEMVNAKRKRNQDVLLGLGLLDNTNKPRTIKKPAAAKRGIKKQKTTTSAQQQPPINSRKSSRIAGTKVNHVALDYNVQNWNTDNKTVVKMNNNNNNNDNDNEDEDESNAKPRYFKGRLTEKAELTITDAINFNDKKWVSDDSIDNAHNFLKELSCCSSNNNDSTKDEGTLSSTFNNKKDDAATIRSMVDDLSIDNEEWVAKVTPDRIYSVTTHPSNNKLLACAGDKQGYVGLWDVNNQYQNINSNNDSNGVHLFHIHSRPVCCMEWSTSDSMITASYDGTIRKFNVEHQSFEEIFAAYDDSDSYYAEELGYGLDEGYRYWLQHVSIDHRHNNSGQCIFAATSTGKAIHIDLRVSSSQGKQHITFNESLSEKKINTLSLHPNGNILASGGLDGIVRLWDIRKFGSSSTRKSTTQGKKSPKPVAYQSVGLSISSSYFSPSGNSLLTTSFTNKLDITENAHLSKGELKKPTYSIRHNNQTGRWLSTFMASWHPKLDIFVCGSMSKPRCMEIFDSNGTMLRQVSGDSMTAVASRCCYHTSTDRLIMIGGNSSGRVVAVQ